MEQELLCGTVAAIVYQNQENGYTVLRLRSQDGEQVTVVGSIPMTVVGERLSITGHWVSHASYGRQFEADLLERLMPESRDEILAYLSSRAVKGVGARTAKRIVDAFGDRSLEVMENEPELLAQVQGISSTKAKEISESFRRQVGMRRLLEFLALHHLPPELAMRLYRAYGELAVDALQDDPYMLAQPYFGADFSVVDAFALELEVEADDERRVEAGILFELTYNQANGHVFIPRDKLTAATASLLELDSETIRRGIDRLNEMDQLIADQVAGLEACYLPELYEAETYICNRVRAMAGQEPKTVTRLDEHVEELQRESSISYAENQLLAIRAAAEKQVLIVTGGPGTGKTTTMAGILRLFDKLKLRTLLAAPTGRAAKRLGECTGREASTIHRLLEAQYDPESGDMCFFHDEENPLRADAVVVDETSMVDVLLMQSLLRALPPRCRLILVGDPDQLPPVGPGSPFSDMLRSGALPMVRLTEIFRQAQESLIVMNAHRVNRGELPDLKTVDRDFFFMRRQSEETVVQLIRELCVQRLPKNMGIPSEQIQVLSPTRKGTVGTGNLNRVLQAALNPPAPGKRERAFGDWVFREGDRVIQTRNNYDILWKSTDGTTVGSGVFNGDVGVIKAIDLQEESVRIVFDDREVDYDFSQLNELELAYAMTVHKSQGSEYRCVILTCWNGSPYLLSRSVLYTAITRARELLILVGREETVAVMTENARKNRRYTGLKLRLQGKVE